MKTLLVLVVVCLVLCEGRISEYRRSKSKRDRDLEEDSYEEDYGDLSLEEAEEDSAPRYDRRLRASVYQPSYGYSKSYRRKYDREDGVKLRKPKYAEERSRGKYLSYEKGPHKTFKKNIVSKQQSFTPEVRDRKKEHRSAPMYEPMYHYPSPPPPSPPPSMPYNKPAPPKARCSQQLLISCTPTVTKVPCSADIGEHHPAPHHIPESPYYEAPAYNAPEPAYSPPTSQYQPPSKPSYHYQPVQPEPVHRPLYHKPGQHPYYHSKPESHFSAPPAYHQSYQPSYKSNDQTPSFAAPVSEDNDEPAVQPVISAFRTTTQRVPTVPADRDQNFQNAENHNHRSQNGGDEAQNQREASGDEPESAQGVTSSTAEPQPSSTPSEDENAQR
ncbi:uncharacterized protein LOC135699482 [Ochlerotatus camptorhynchus]|uniref:uncharacterized protein LOC135699482 n=1 Tax=Ochlerotatus camptorhynchus TaxID=644619 RepID=UPI0031D0CF80